VKIFIQQHKNLIRTVAACWKYMQITIYLPSWERRLKECTQHLTFSVVYSLCMQGRGLCMP